MQITLPKSVQAVVYFRFCVLIEVSDAASGKCEAVGTAGSYLEAPLLNCHSPKLLATFDYQHVAITLCEGITPRNSILLVKDSWR